MWIVDADCGIWNRDYLLILKVQITEYNSRIGSIIRNPQAASRNGVCSPVGTAIPKVATVRAELFRAPDVVALLVDVAPAQANYNARQAAGGGAGAGGRRGGGD